MAATLAGGDGRDTLTGNGGSNVFVCGGGDWNDTITDFSTDPLTGRVIRLVNSGYASAQAVIDAATDTATGVQLAIGSDVLLLEGMFRSDLTANDFVLV